MSVIADSYEGSGNLAVIQSDSSTPPNCLDSILYPKSGYDNYYDAYTIFDSAYQSLYFSEWVKPINYSSSHITGGWSTAVGVGGFECGPEARYASAEIVAVTFANGSYWGVAYPVDSMYPPDGVRTWNYVASNVQVVDGQWMHFVLYFNTGRNGNDGNITLWAETTPGQLSVIASAYGFDSVKQDSTQPDLNYQSTGVWAGQYIANGLTTGTRTEFYIDTVEAYTVFPD